MKNDRNTIKLDEYDTKIIYHLDVDGRISLTKISHLLGKSEAFVKYRVDRMKREGVLVKYTLVTDRSRLGFRHYRIFLRVVGSDQIEEVITYLKSKKDVNSIKRVLGKYQLYISVYTKKIQYLEDFIVALVQQFPEVIVDYGRMLVFASYSLAHNFLYKTKIHHIEQLDTAEELTLSEKERQIIQILVKNPRISFFEMSKVLGSDLRTVKALYAGLKKKKVILHVRPTIDVRKLGYLHKQVMIKLTFPGLGMLSEVEHYLLGLRSTKSLSKTFGNYDFLGRFVFKDMDEFQQFEQDLYEHFGRHIQQIDFHDYMAEKKV